jgi:hypothetical protein
MFLQNVGWLSKDYRCENLRSYMVLMMLGLGLSQVTTTSFGILPSHKIQRYLSKWLLLNTASPPSWCFWTKQGGERELMQAWWHWEVWEPQTLRHYRRRHVLRMRVVPPRCNSAGHHVKFTGIQNTASTLQMTESSHCDLLNNTSFSFLGSSQVSEKHCLIPQDVEFLNSLSIKYCTDIQGFHIHSHCVLPFCDGAWKDWKTPPCNVHIHVKK